MLIQFNFVQQCIQISTRINSTSVHTYILRLFYIASSIRVFILIDPIFNTSHRRFHVLLTEDFMFFSQKISCSSYRRFTHIVWKGAHTSSIQRIRKHSSRMSNDRVGVRPIVNRITDVSENITFPCGRYKCLD